MSNPLTDEVVARSQLTDDFLFQVVDDPNGTPTQRTVSITDVEAVLAELAPQSDSEFYPPTSNTSTRHLDVGVPAALVSANLGVSSDRMVLVRFSVSRKITVNTVQVASDSTASAGLTSARLGIYACGDDGDNWAMGRSADDTTLFNTGQTLYSKTLDTTDGWPAAITLVPGRFYAASVGLVGTTMPTLGAGAALRTQMQSLHNGRRASAGLTNAGWVNVASTGVHTGCHWARLLEGGTENVAHTAVLLGDSFLASYATWAGDGNASGGARLHFIRNKGTGSETLAQMYARFAADVTAYRPEWCLLHGGTNDIFAEGATSATVIARYGQIITAAQAAGISLLICTPPSNTGASAGQKVILAAVRAYLLALSETGVVVCDTGTTLSTGDGVTADAAKLVDAVHPNATGIAAMAVPLAATIAAIT